MDDVSDVPVAFLNLGWRSILLLLAAGAVAMGALSFLFVVATADEFSWLTVAGIVGSIFGLLIALSAVFAVRRAFGKLTDWYEFEQEQRRMQAEALLREQQPQPFIEVERPILVNKPIAVEVADKINDVPIAAVEYFVQQLCRGVPFTQAKWDKLTLPGGYVVASFESYSHLIDPLVELGFIVDRDGERRKSGRLTTTDKDAIIKALRNWERQRSSP